MENSNTGNGSLDETDMQVTFLTEVTEEKLSILWSINGFSLCDEKTGEIMRSPKFRLNGMDGDWELQFFPNGNNDACKEYVSLYVSSSSESVNVNCELSLLDVSKKKSITKKFTYHNFVKGWGYKQFCKRSDIFLDKAKLLSSDTLTISCELSTKQTTRHRNHNVSGLFKSMESTDIQLKSGEESLPAHKSVLSSRSSVFAAMFSNAMRENLEEHIEINNVEPDVLKQVVNFIYTDRASVPDVDFALKLFVAADKYDIGDLRNMCVDFLKNKVDARHAVRIAKLAENFGLAELRKLCMDVICRELSSEGEVHPELFFWRLEVTNNPQLLSEINAFLLKDTALARNSESWMSN